MAEKRKAAVAGVTGLVGRGLPALLAEQGFSVTGISRGGAGNVPGVDRWQRPEAMDLSGHQAVINLAGEPVNQRWTEERKKRFRDSRVGYTEKLVAAIGRLPEGERPEVLVNASAVGYYGNRGDEFLTEAAGAGDGYLADLCRDWEDAAMAAEDLGVRTVMLRIGLVLGKEGGAYRQLRGIFRMGIGGRLGDGRQWMPWIHIDDLRRGIIHAVVSGTLRGPVNGTAPAPERNADFTRKFTAAMHRPAIFPVPAFALKLAFGEFAQALLDSGRAVPSALVADGFVFRFGTLEDALAGLDG
ncbi:TIGR01777 family oxidoreductase [Luteolibacter sp. SL250]|uniref:TIGR01777 family oxidoreductase n=1 Tax=Luteolibacter sp. SL250 TaxID=2995170 RepID=UPI0022722B8D|nr:TIGR01777 family oxidoreductase [Luteolibacter sp. SL250]WAC20321.1 TIGR01777 family oxidoreductase [Luteolibacter sp. SL250]